MVLFMLLKFKLISSYHNFLLRSSIDLNFLVHVVLRLVFKLSSVKSGATSDIQLLAVPMGPLSSSVSLLV